MLTKAGKFTFTVPSDSPSPDAGKKLEKAFEFKECETDEEALTVLTEKKWSVKDIINTELKSGARANAYQSALLPYKPSEVAPEDIKERMIRDFMRLGQSEENARKLVDGLVGSVATKVEGLVDSVESTQIQ